MSMPQIIPQSELSMTYVESLRKEAMSAWKRRSQTTKVSQHRLTDSHFELFLFRKSAKSGIYFVIHENKVGFLYAYQAATLPNPDGSSPKFASAAEALAFSFDENVVGVIKNIFFDFLLPAQKFVVTDSIYTPTGSQMVHG